jgi:hypothetical protein
MARLRDIGSEPFDSVPAGAGPVSAPDDRWVVLAGRAGPVSAIAPGITLAEDDRPPGILVAAADMDVADVLDSEAFEQFADIAALVLTEPDEDRAGEFRIVGVLSGGTVARLVFRGAVRAYGPGPVLPGPPAIPLIARSCGHAEAGTMCATPMSFSARPAAMPACPNHRGMSAHQFDW